MARVLIPQSTVKSMVARGLTAREAAEETGFKKASLQCAANRMGLSFAPDLAGQPQRVTKEQALDMDARGLTVAQAAHETGVSEGYMRKMAALFGVRMQKKRAAPKNDTVRPARPPAKPTTIATAMAQLARQENRAMRERCFNK